MSSRPQVSKKSIKEFIKKQCRALDLYYFLSLMIDCRTVENFVEREKSHKIIVFENCRVNTLHSYAFTQCVKKSLSSKVGCKLPWDEETKGKATVSISISIYLYLKFQFQKWAARRPGTIKSSKCFLVYIRSCS